MTRSRLLLGVASVFAGTTVLLSVFGLVYNPLLLPAAAPFAVAAYLVWSHATGRLNARVRERPIRGRVDPAGSRAPAGAGRPRSGGQPPRDGPGPRGDAGSVSGRRRSDPREGTVPSRSSAADVLGVDPDADRAEVRRAFREKARELHPDAPGGDEAAFRRVRTAYERLVDGR